MRLQLIALAAIVVVPARAAAQNEPDRAGEAATRVLVYSDDDATQVVTSAADVRVDLTPRVTLGAHALVDAVSSASVDVVSAATERWSENRVELGGRASTTLAGNLVSLAYARSQENDWRSHALTIAARRELFQRNTALSARYTATLNTVGRASDPNFERDLDAHSFELTASQLVDPRTRVTGTYSLQLLSGYLSSPYRYVRSADGASVPERHPDARARQSVSASAARALGDNLAAHASYRFYIDDWGVHSHTGVARLAAELGRWLVGLEARAYRQRRADFYRGTYATTYRYMSNDRELSTFWDAGGVADLAVALGPAVIDAKVGVIHYRFKNFPALRTRNALLAGGGVSLTW